MQSTETHIVPFQIDKQRIGNYAINIFKAAPTKSGFKKALKKGEVKIDGRIAKSRDWVFGGEEVVLTKVINVKPCDLDYDVVYQDDHLAVINKPAGIPVHSHGHRNIQNSLPVNLSETSLEGALLIPRPVHRLDHETSGLLIVAKTYSAMTKLVQDLANRTINKNYLAVCIGKLTETSPIITELNGKACETKFKILATIDSEKYEQLNLLKIDLKTGRRNQIRRHFMSIGNPILGDKKFFIPEKVSYGNGLYLVANKLVLRHPITNSVIDLTLPIHKKYSRLFPNYFENRKE